MAYESKTTDSNKSVEGLVDDDSIKFKRILLNTIHFYAEDKEQELMNSPHPLPQFPLFVGNAVRSITFWAQFNKNLLQSHAWQCLISIGYSSKSESFNIVKYGNRIGVMGYDYDHYPNQGQVEHNITEWNHYAVVYDGKILTIYINGEIDTQIDRKYQTKDTLSQTNFIGCSNHKGHEQPFYGKMKQIRFYGKNLRQQEVKLLARDL